MGNLKTYPYEKSIEPLLLSYKFFLTFYLFMELKRNNFQPESLFMRILLRNICFL